MAGLSVAEAARRLGVGVQRIHQRIADGSVSAERIGSQWVVDELSLLRVAERRSAGRPLSARSAWALIALEAGDEGHLIGLAPVERARARARLGELFALVPQRRMSEGRVREVAVVLRSWFRNRASRELYRAASADLPALREDPRWQPLGLSSPASGIGAADLAEGYLAAVDVLSLRRDLLLVAAERDANVIIHALSEVQRAYPESRLLLAADLAEHRGPREEHRAAELLRESARIHLGGRR